VRASRGAVWLAVTGGLTGGVNTPLEANAYLVTHTLYSHLPKRVGCTRLTSVGLGKNLDTPSSSSWTPCVQGYQNQWSNPMSDA
jgi:hypothetical protein